MEYRNMKNDEKVSLLGFGCMRFPLTENGNIHEEKAVHMIDMAISHGVNYIDTAYPYHNGESEPFLGRALKKYPRNSYYLATKLPMYKIQTLQDAKQLFEEQLQRLDTDYIDFYLLHAMNKQRWQLAKEAGIITYCEQLKSAGRIKNFGFSFHDTYDVFEEMIEGRDWDFCQIQYNYVDRDIQAGDKGYALCVKKNIPLIVMEPIKGGNLSVLPKDIASQFHDVSPQDSISSWALRWVGTHDQVRIILSGMSDLQQVQDNLATFDEFHHLNENELQLVDKVADMINKRMKNGCTACGYCMPCPYGIDIPSNFKIWNEYGKYANHVSAIKRYADLGNKQAAFCKACGQCETKCPQSIAIRHDLQQMHEEIKYNIMTRRGA